MLNINLSLRFVTIFVLFNISQIYSQTAQSLLKEAYQVYTVKPEEGIKKATMSYRYAIKTNQKIYVIKSLDLLSIIHWDIRAYKQARKFSNQALALAEKYGIDSLSASVLNNSALIDYSEANYESAINKYKIALSYFNKLKNENNQGLTYMNLGMSEKKLSRFDFANFYYFKAAEIFHKLNDKVNLCSIYNAIGNCFSSLKNLPNAIRYYKMALSISENLNDKYLIAQSLNNMGYAYMLSVKPDSSIKYLTKCLEIRKSEKDSGLMVLTLQNLSAAWRQKGSFELATKYILRSMPIAEKLKMKDELARGNYDLAELYFVKHNYDEAGIQLIKAEQLSLAINSAELLEQCYQLHSKLAERLGKYNDALIYERKRDRLDNNLFNITKSRAISEIELKYQTKQKDRDIKALHEQTLLGKKVVNLQKYSIIALAAALILLLLLLFLANKNSIEKKRDHIRIQNLMKELHHRVKNNLQILSGLFTLQLSHTGDENVRESIRDNEMRLNSMNLIHQKLYFNETDTKIPIKEYMVQLMKHIQISFRDKNRNISLIVDLEDITIEAEIVVSIGLIVNELSTNAYKYAFNDRDGEIYIGFKKKEKDIFLLTVRDNGVGLAAADGAVKSSFGLKLVGMMAQQLNSELRIKNDGGLCYELEVKIVV